MSRDVRVPSRLVHTRVPREVREVLRVLDLAGHRSWLVGGLVRDLLLGRPRGADYDVATPATPQQVLALFPRAIPTGIDHGTVTVLVPDHKVEVTTFRGEGAYEDGRRPSSVTFLADVDGDLARRDFAMNAMAWDPVGGAFRDPYGGREDLRRRRVRAVGDPAERFAEDGLRPLRAVRFAAQLRFSLDPATREAISGALGVVTRVSAERISDELGKILQARDVPRGLALLDETQLLGAVFPDLGHLPSDARAHALAAAGVLKGDLAARLAALLHPLAEHEAPLQAARRVREALTRLRFPGGVCEEAAALVREHGCLRARGRPPAPVAPAEVRRLLARVGKGRVPGLLALRLADAQALPAPARGAEVRDARALARRCATALRGRPPLTTADLALDGQAVMSLLGVGPGPDVGEALRHLLDRVLDDPRANTRRALTSLLREWRARREAPEDYTREAGGRAGDAER